MAIRRPCERRGFQLRPSLRPRAVELVKASAFGTRGAVACVSIIALVYFTGASLDSSFSFLRGPRSLQLPRHHSRTLRHAESLHDRWPNIPIPPRETPSLKTPYADRKAYGETNRIPEIQGVNNWTDYTRFAMGVEDYGPDLGVAELDKRRSSQNKAWVFDRKRTIGVDFGPQFVGLALSLGGTTTIPLGTIRTGDDWKEVSLNIAQMASSRRVRDIVIGWPLEKDGSEGEIAFMVHKFAKMTADAVLLLIGPTTKVYLWDERFSTMFAAMRLIIRPNFEASVFKSWLDSDRGLNIGAKGILDSEAARAILEHFLEKNEDTGELNRERAPLVAPSPEAAKAYLMSKRKQNAKLEEPTTPSGPGLESFVWETSNREKLQPTAEDLDKIDSSYDRYMRGMNFFGQKQYEELERQKRKMAEQVAEERRKRAKVDLEDIRNKLRGSGTHVEKEGRKHKAFERFAHNIKKNIIESAR